MEKLEFLEQKLKHMEQDIDKAKCDISSIQIQLSILQTKLENIITNQIATNTKIDSLINIPTKRWESLVIAGITAIITILITKFV